MINSDYAMRCLIMPVTTKQSYVELMLALQPTVILLKATSPATQLTDKDDMPNNDNAFKYSC